MNRHLEGETHNLILRVPRQRSPTSPGVTSSATPKVASLTTRAQFDKAEGESDLLQVGVINYWFSLNKALLNSPFSEADTLEGGWLISHIFVEDCFFFSLFSRIFL